MTIEIRPELEHEIRRLAQERGRDIDSIVAEAARQYIEATAITDLTSEQTRRRMRWRRNCRSSHGALCASRLRSTDGELEE